MRFQQVSSYYWYVSSASTRDVYEDQSDPSVLVEDGRMVIDSPSFNNWFLSVVGLLIETDRESEETGERKLGDTYNGPLVFG